MTHLFRLFVVGAILCLTYVACPGQDYSLDHQNRVHRLDSSAEVYIDHDKTASFEQVISNAYAEKFHKSGDNLTFGYSSANIWLKWNIRTASPSNTWLLEIPAPYLEYVDFYQLNNGAWRHSQSGYFRPHSIREFRHTGHVFPLTFNNDSTTVVYVLIAGDSPKTFPVLAKEKEKFIENARIEDTGYGIFFGILMVMFFYNLFIFIALRQINYLIYIFTIVCTFLIFSSASGYAGMYLWPDFPAMNFYAGRMSLPFQAIAVALFSIRFLEVKKYSRTMYYFLLSLIPLSVIAGILVATGLLSSAGNNLITVATVTFMSAGLVCRIKGNTTANYFIAAWAVYLIGGLLLTLRNSGFLPYNFITTHFVEAGAALETVIIAFALAARYRGLRIEKDEAQHLALKLQQETTERLEAKVRQRTDQLSKLNDELRDTLETNRKQTEIIEEKNAELDSFFYRISHDLKGPISSLKGLAFLARMEVQDETARDYMEKQIQQVDRLDLIINGLINLTRVNQSNLEKTLIDFHKLTSDCIQSFQAHPKFKLISFRTNIGENLKFYSEWTLVNAILQNLIENAIKYSAESREAIVMIRIFAVGNELILEVEDNGQGIPKEHHDKIFEIFHRATQNTTGTGLGLYILKRSVDRINGRIGVKSTEDAGSTFTIKLPY